MALRNFNFAFQAKRDVPAERVAGNRQVLDLAHGIAAPAKSHPAELRDPNLTPAAVNATCLDLALPRPGLNAKSVAAALSPRARVAGTSGKEVGEPAVEVAKCLLEDIGMGLREPWEGPLEFRELGVLRGPTDTLAADPPAEAALLERGVPDRACTPRPARKRSLLLGSWVEAIAVAATLLHERMFAGGPDATGCAARSSSRLEPRASWSRVR